MSGDDLLAESTDVQRCLEEVLHRGEALTVPRLVHVLCDPVEHLLGGGEVAGRLQHEGAVRPGVDHMELAVGADVVEPGVGSGVGDEEQGVGEARRKAVGHRRGS